MYAITGVYDKLTFNAVDLVVTVAIGIVVVMVGFIIIIANGRAIAQTAGAFAKIFFLAVAA